MKEKTKLKLITLIIMLAMVVCLPVGNVKAALQSNPNTQYKKSDTLTNWLVNIRNMEKSGEAMGLSEEFNEDYTSKESNGIDVHMIRSTEYGAIAILSASGYGNPKTLQASTEKTTTGNKTGIYFGGKDRNFECVAGVLEGKINNISSRYYDSYTTSIESAKIGDALGNKKTKNAGCAGWHSATRASWINTSDVAFTRGSAGLFSYHIYGNTRANGYETYARGVAVCGAGL